MKDLTAIYLTVNKLPQGWVDYHKKILLEAIDGYADLITVSRKKMDMPGINLIQDGKICASNIYRQMLRAAKLAKTKYIAVVEDDSLYHRQHFEWFRPKDDEFAYNMSRWAVFTWGKPTYFWRDRLSNLTLLAPTKLTIEALEERFKKYPDGTPEHRTGELGKDRIEDKLGLTKRKFVKYMTTIPVINLNHIYSLDPRERNMRKRMSLLRCYDVPYWGRAEEITKHFK